MRETEKERFVILDRRLIGYDRVNPLATSPDGMTIRIGTSCLEVPVSPVRRAQ